MYAICGTARATATTTATGKPLPAGAARVLQHDRHGAGSGGHAREERADAVLLGDRLGGHHHDRAGALRLRTSGNGLGRREVGRRSAHDERAMTARLRGNDIRQPRALVGRQRFVFACHTRIDDAVRAGADRIARDGGQARLVRRAVGVKRRRENPQERRPGEYPRSSRCLPLAAAQARARRGHRRSATIERDGRCLPRVSGHAASSDQVGGRGTTPAFVLRYGTLVGPIRRDYGHPQAGSMA